MAEEFNVQGHIFVPKHTKLKDEEKSKVLEQYNISMAQLPKILKSDPALKELNAELGDIIKIERNSVTTGKSLFFRGVIDG